MKKIVLFILLIVGTISTTFAAEKSYKNGQVTAYLSGDRVEIIDNVNNVCIVVTVTRHQNSAGEILYDLACGNKYTKNVTKLAMKTAISTLITGAATAVGGPSGTAAGAAISAVASSIAGDAYDDMCNYFGN